jgi:hypothetical protein
LALAVLMIRSLIRTGLRPGLSEVGGHLQALTSWGRGVEWRSLPWRGALRAAIAIAAVLAVLPAPALADGGLRAGAGRSDITPPTSYPMLGWARGDARALGQHTRLFARALVLQRGSRRLALVAADLNMIPGGLVVQSARRAGFSSRTSAIDCERRAPR